MGSPRKGSTGVGAITSGISNGLERSVSDIGTGLQQIATGDVEKGLNNLATGNVNLYTGGAGERAGLKGERLLTEEANDAALQEANDAKDAAIAKEDARKTAIRKRIDAEIAFRAKTPGRSQTLLTDFNRTMTNLSPGANNTLLTTGR